MMNKGQFKKGQDHPSWKGEMPKCMDCDKTLSTRKSLRCQKHNNKLLLTRVNQKGRIPWNKGQTGGIAWNKGTAKPIERTCVSCKTIFLVGKWRLNTSRAIYCSRKCQLPWNKGIPNLSAKGEKNYNWKGGVTPVNEKIRKSLEYEEWRKSVFEQDSYTCQMCGEVGGRLNADHIKPFSLFPELRLDLSNGQTLCIKCHRIKTIDDIKNIAFQTKDWGKRKDG